VGAGPAPKRGTQRRTAENPARGGDDRLGVDEARNKATMVAQTGKRSIRMAVSSIADPWGSNR